MEIKRIATDTRRSRAVVYNGMVFVGGQTADDRSQDIRGQTLQTLAKIEKFLADAGTDKSRLLTAQIWIKDLERDLARKEKALAETAALLVLRKKAAAIWGGDEDA